MDHITAQVLVQETLVTSQSTCFISKVKQSGTRAGLLRPSCLRTRRGSFTLIQLKPHLTLLRREAAVEKGRGHISEIRSRTLNNQPQPSTRFATLRCRRSLAQ